jgi:ATP synthase protein I
MGKWQSALRYVGLGWFVGICIAGGVLGGLWLDGEFHTRGLLVVVGLVAGVIVAFYGVYRMILPDIKNKQNKGDG